MSKAVICPVCKGKGYNLIECKNIPCEKEHKKCHGCEGKGWIEISGSMPLPMSIPVGVPPPALPWFDPWQLPTWPCYPGDRTLQPFTYTITYSGDTKDETE